MKEKKEPIKKKKLLIRCPKCLRENYLPNVVTGICTWCGFDVNK